MEDAQIDRITREIEALEERRKKAMAKIFRNEETTAEEYYDAFWERWKREHGK